MEEITRKNNCRLKMFRRHQSREEFFDDLNLLLETIGHKSVLNTLVSDIKEDIQYSAPSLCIIDGDLMVTRETYSSSNYIAPSLTLEIPQISTSVLHGQEYSENYLQHQASTIEKDTIVAAVEANLDYALQEETKYKKRHRTIYRNTESVTETVFRDILFDTNFQVSMFSTKS